MTESREIIALAGLSGSGKTTLIESVASRYSYIHLSASDLIKKQKEESGKTATSEQLRKSDIDDNQLQFVKAFEAQAGKSSDPILLDCHTLIDTPTGVQYVPISTFAAINITRMVFLSVEPGRLLERRLADTSRTRPQRSLIELSKQQESALLMATEISINLNIPFDSVEHEPQNELELILRRENHTQVSGS